MPPRKKCPLNISRLGKMPPKNDCSKILTVLVPIIFYLR